MAAFVDKFKVTIAAGQSTSQWIRQAQGAAIVGIIAPSVLAETVTFEVSEDQDGTGNVAVLQNSTPADIAGPVAAKARTYVELCAFRAWRIKLSANPSSSRDFIVSVQWTTPSY